MRGWSVASLSGPDGCRHWRTSFGRRVRGRHWSTTSPRRDSPVRIASPSGPAHSHPEGGFLHGICGAGRVGPHAGEAHLRRRRCGARASPATGSTTAPASASPTCSTRRSRERVDELEDVKIRALPELRPRAVLEADPGREHFHWFNWHFTGYDRTKGDAGLANYIPCNLGEIPRLLPPLHRPAGDRGRSRPARRTSTASSTSASQRSGTARSLERAKIVIVEESRRRCRTCTASRTRVHESEVDYVDRGRRRAAARAPEPAARPTPTAPSRS